MKRLEERIINIQEKLLSPQQEEFLLDLWRNGGVVVFPTETAYGLGVNGLDVSAVRKVFELKQRSLDKPIHLIVDSLKMAEFYAEISGEALKLMEKFWPGPLTLVCPKKKNVPDLLTGGLPTVGLRNPDHKFFKSLQGKFDFPITATSANLSGGKTPYSIKEVLAQLPLSEIDLVLDGGQLSFQLPSTIVDVSVSPMKILREGPISQEDLEG